MSRTRTARRMALHHDSQLPPTFQADTDRMSARIQAIRKRVALGATALLVVALAAVTTWGRQAKATPTHASSVLQQERELDTGAEDDAVTEQAPETGPAPLTTRQS